MVLNLANQDSFSGFERKLQSGRETFMLKSAQRETKSQTFFIYLFWVCEINFIAHMP